MYAPVDRVGLLKGIRCQDICPRSRAEVLLAVEYCEQALADTIELTEGVEYLYRL